MRTFCRRSFSVVALLLCSGCISDLLVSGCNLVGCVNGLTITLSRGPDGAYTVQLLVAGEAPREVACTGPGSCSDARVFFENALPTVATVVITSAAGEVRQEARPTYTTSRPNGRGCDPVCRNGVAVVNVPVSGSAS
jgi:hypothetical protein